MQLPRGKITLTLILSSSFLLLGSWLYAAGKSPYSLSQLISAKEKIANMAQQVTQTQMRWAAIESNLNPQVSVALEIDEQRLEQDYQKFISEQTALLAKNKSEQLQKQKQYIEELAAAAKSRDDQAAKEAEEARLAKEAKAAQEAKAAKEAEEAKRAKALKDAEDAKRAKAALPKSELRLGMLNIDISSQNQASETDTKPELKLATPASEASPPITVVIPPPTARNSQTIALSIAMPSEDKSEIAKFDYDIMDYVKSLSIKIVLPEKLPTQLEDSIRQAIVAALELKIFKGADIGKMIQFSVLTVDKKPPPTWRDQFINPEKGRVWDLSSALILGLLVLLGTLMVAKGFTKIASGIRELKADK
ncbi:MAG: hypothetical protein NTX25_14405, partial [Proteobacteria bacterium]|nr:hypothetical protein [Pseudomonadota bacterium]